MAAADSIAWGKIRKILNKNKEIVVSNIVARL
jgi:hypothetical protein